MNNSNRDESIIQFETEYAQVRNIIYRSSSVSKMDSISLLFRDIVNDNDAIEYINTDLLEQDIAYFMRSVSVYKRFLTLAKQVNKQLFATENGFELLGNTFSTLDEVERAIKVKAFL